jgi:alkyldihydroxyacetonephosphate synthase
MRRWNGWGDESVRLDLPRAALAYLRERIGAGVSPRDATFESVVAFVPPSRLRPASFIDASPQTRVRHARGQSLPDWIALRSGQLGCVPDGVAFPHSAADVRDLVQFARETGACVIPYGGGTSVAGHVNPLQGDAPVLTVSMAHMRRLLHFDEQSRVARFEAGVAGPDLEAQLRSAGYTLGHFPQSFEYSTLGGWIATRSSGQQSLRYGRIEQLFASANVETPRGRLEIPSFPASAAGLDIRELVLGCEGRIGIITQAAVRVRPVAAHESFHAWFFRDWNRARDAARALVQNETGLSMVRLAGESETRTTLRMAASRGTALLQAWLALRGQRGSTCLLIAGVTGSTRAAEAALKHAREIAARHGALYAGRRPGSAWKDLGYAVDTIETAVDWTRVDAMIRGMEAAARAALGNHVHAYAHLSHVYPQGSSVYGTFIFPIAADPQATMERGRRLKAAVSAAIVQHGGTISHQHGVGTDHREYLRDEKGELGLNAMRAVFATFDPDGMMNPGKLV